MVWQGRIVQLAKLHASRNLKHYNIQEATLNAQKTYVVRKRNVELQLRQSARASDRQPVSCPTAQLAAKSRANCIGH